MRRPERLRYAEQTISDVTDHLVAGRLWSGELERFSGEIGVGRV